MLAGTHTPVGAVLPGISSQMELVLIVEAGLPPAAALQLATVKPRPLARARGGAGTVAPGKLADLVLLDADPLADIRNARLIRRMVKGGRVYDPKLLVR